MLPVRSRSLFFLAFVVSVAAVSAVLYLELVVGLAPCALCLVQRFFLVAFGLVCLVATVHGPTAVGRRVYAAVALLFALCGGFSATRQLWLQAGTAPSDIACQPGIAYLWQTQPWPEVVKALVLGSPECARVNWTLLDMSLPEWSLLAFTGMLAFAVWQLLQRSR